MLDDHLAGPTGLVLAGADPLPAAKVLGRVRQGAREAVGPNRAWWTGRPVDPAYVKRLGELPSREELLGQFAGVRSNGVLYQVVGALEALEDKASSLKRFLTEAGETKSMATHDERADPRGDRRPRRWSSWPS